jgi:hypothetical protein
MPIFELLLTDFAFPATLPESRSTFRVLMDVRYIDGGGKMATEHAVLPGLDSYWECEKSHAGEANFVRHPTNPQLDMTKIDQWDRLFFLIKATSLHSLQIRVIDIEKEGGFLDKIKDYAGSIVEALIGTAKTAALGAIPAPAAFVKEAFGSAVHDVEAFALSQLAGAKRQDALIFKVGTRNIPQTAGGGPLVLTGPGTKGNYRIDLQVNVTP